MIENELRELLSDRAGAVPDNAGRVGEVHARITGIRRRRAAGAALALVLLALAGLALTRLPGRPESLPTGVPDGPWFGADNKAEVPGYQVVAQTLIRGPDYQDVLMVPQDLRVIVVVRCDQRGTIVVRSLGAEATASVDCSRPVGDRFEGVTALDPATAQRVFSIGALGAGPDSTANVRWEPGPGLWDVAVLRAIAYDRLQPWDRSGRPLVEGPEHPDGTATVPVTVPSDSGSSAGRPGFAVLVECVQGVRLTVSVPRGTLGTAVCDQGHGLSAGVVDLLVTEADANRLGLHEGDRVQLTVRSTGAKTDQWRVGFLF